MGHRAHRVRIVGAGTLAGAAVAELDRRRGSVSEGPGPDGEWTASGDWDEVCLGAVIMVQPNGVRFHDSDDAYFVVAAVNGWPAISARYHEMEQEIAELRAKIAEMEKAMTGAYSILLPERQEVAIR